MPPVYKWKTLVRLLDVKGVKFYKGSKHPTITVVDESGTFTNVSYQFFGKHDGDIHRDRLKKQSKAFGLDHAFFLEVVDCTKSHGQLLAQLRENGRLKQ